MQAFLRFLTAPFRLLLGGPARLFALPRRLLGMTLPARVATLLSVALLTFTLAVVIAFIQRGDVPHAEVLLVPQWIAAILVVLIGLPIATYHLLRLWLQGDTSRFPDIDRAWDQGVAALAEHGVDVCDLPLFLLLGSSEAEVTDRIVSEAGPVMIDGVPKGRSPLRWYVSEEAIYLALTGASRLQMVNAAARPYHAAVANDASPDEAETGPTGNVGATMVVGAAPVGAPSRPPETPVPGPNSGTPKVYATLMVGGDDFSGNTLDSASSPAPPPPATLSPKLLDEQTERLRYVCDRLRRSRQPYCANNGVLTLLPLQMLFDISSAKDAPAAIRSDLSMISDATKLRSPVTVCVVGMESELGFTELVRRVGVSRAQASRFGKGFNVWNLASDENLDAFSSHACGAFEDFVYKLFGDGLDEQGNGKLYTILCRVRRYLQPRLRNILVRGFAAGETNSGGANAPLFGGCYFAATGSTLEKQAFVRSVLDKVNQQAEDLQWTEAALQEEVACKRFAQISFVVNAFLLCAIGWLLYQYIN